MVLALLVLLGALLGVAWFPTLVERWSARRYLAAVRALAAAEGGWAEFVVAAGPGALASIPVGDSIMGSVGYPGRTSVAVKLRALSPHHILGTSQGLVLDASGAAASSRGIVILLRSQTDSAGVSYLPVRGPYWWQLPEGP